MSHSTVAHRWFHQTGNFRTKENYYSSGNIFYKERIIYSYGHHFALAIRFDDLVVFNSKGYSSSTGKHQSHTRDAIDTHTHEIFNVPLINARHFDYRVKKKDVYKYIDFKDFVGDFEQNLKKLGNARKPEIYLDNIANIQNKLEKIFKRFRGSKTYVLKTKGISKVLKFEFTDATKAKLKRGREIELAKRKAEKKANAKEALKDLIEYENGKNILGWRTLDYLDLNTVIRVKDSLIKTSKGIHIELSHGLRMFKLWEAGKAIGKEIRTKHGSWTCTKANGSIKFGCHVINYKQAKRVLTPYL